ncbi:MAG: hypothetical protein M0P13_01740 [Fibrobacteraceae bacterium]|nr:hypothetical protein [Fibrobacteraceae bacterium]
MSSTEMKQTMPFSANDFFGYLLPGLIFTLSFYGWSRYAHLSWVMYWDKCDIKNISVGGSIFYMFFAFAVVYFFGHIIGSISHIIYDRILIRNIIGYPLQYILGTGFKPKPEIRATYLLALVILFILAIMPGIFEVYLKFWQSDFYESLQPRILNIEDFEKFLAHCAVVVFVVLIFLLLTVIRFRLRTIDAEVAVRSEKKILKNLREFINGKILFLMAISVNFLSRCIFFPIRKFVSTDSRVDKEIANKFISEMNEQHNVNANSYNSDAYWMASISLAQDPKIDAKLTNWLNLYGCLRNYSCALFMLAMIIASYHWYKILTLIQIHDLRGSRILLVSIVISGILFFRYWIIYYSYYSKYIIRAYVFKNESRV